jgi:hypothetical protein
LTLSLRWRKAPEGTNFSAMMMAMKLNDIPADPQAVGLIVLLLVTKITLTLFSDRDRMEYSTTTCQF